MSSLLVLKTSIFGDNGQSTRLAEEFLRLWTAQRGTANITVRDFQANPLPHLDQRVFAAFTVPEDKRNEAQREAASLSDQLLAELMAADTIVLAAPMYNRGIPSQLKSYIDHVVRAGKTFRYTAQGPVGLAGGKRVAVLSARGGYYLGKPSDTHTLYINDILNFIGIEDIHWVVAEGLNIDAATREKSMNKALEQVGELCARLLQSAGG